MEDKIIIIAQLIEQFCCRACDGYNCQNEGNGRPSQEIAKDIINLLEEK